MDEQQLALTTARQVLAQHLECLSRAGVMQIGKVPAAKPRPVVGVNALLAPNSHLPN